VLKHLTIKNFALIETLEAEFYEGFSVMTGETGAGKSIILGALSLILGNRADLQSLKNKSRKCIIEGIFHINNGGLEDIFLKHNLDYDPETTILRREILPSGKSRTFINDTPVSLSGLKEIAPGLVDIHTQNSALLLQDSSFQLRVLDGFAGNEYLIQQYRQFFDHFKKLTNELNGLIVKEQQAATEQDFLVFQLDELQAAKLNPAEQKSMEAELEILNHSEEIKTALFNSSEHLDNENGLLTGFRSLVSELKPMQKFSGQYSELLQRIESNFLDMKDISEEIAGLSEKVEINPERIEQLNERLNLIYQLQQKHRVDSIEALIEIRDQIAGKISSFKSLGDKIEHISNKLKAAETELKAKAEEISKSRHRAKPSLENKIKSTINSLGMPEAALEIRITNVPALTDSGQDKISFLFNANKGGQLMEMAKVASGGELSRLMLAIKANVAAQNLVNTIIFDEIDSGVSGEIAGKMAAIMQQLGKSLQVIAITHLPQIAAKGRYHYLVKKDAGNETTLTSLQLLTHDERQTEIAKMLSDATVTAPAMEAAKALLSG
jgi:DNA repair protein RecN (Recombination protein N)